LQIIHISDLHIVKDNAKFSSKMRVTRWLTRNIKKLRPAYDLIRDGTAPHDQGAPSRFIDYLVSDLASDPSWRGLPTWLVDTGDLTTWGDDDSLDQGRDFIRRAQSALAIPPDSVVSLYGNHDAWPQNLPFFQRQAATDAQRHKLRASYYPSPCPSQPLIARVPGSNSEVQLYWVNTVLHKRVRNSFVYGLVREDPGTISYGDQLDRLATLIDQYQGSHGAPNLRILATHHPIHYPPPEPTIGMRVWNSRDVATRLNSASPLGTAPPLIHVLLSGHVHLMFPEYGRLPTTVGNCGHGYLGKKQCQLVVGSLMQEDPTGKRGLWTHQFQVLRFYHSRIVPTKWRMERWLVARSNGLGPFLEIPPQQQMLLDL